MTIRISLPSSMLVANLVGVAGLAGVVVAVGGLAGLWWAVLAAGVILVGLSVIASTHATADVAAPVASAPANPAPPRHIAPATASVAAPVTGSRETQAA